MAHVLIAGCGWLGEALGLRLVAQGHVVWGLRRHRQRLPTALEQVEADLQVPNTLRHLPAVDFVFYLASPERDDAAARRAARVAGVRYLLAALAAGRQRIRRLFVASSVAIYGDRDGAWVDEDTALGAPPPGAADWLAGEALGAEAPFPATAIRLGELYGPGRPGALDALWRGRPIPVRKATEHVCPIHRDDAAGALVHLMGRRDPEPRYLLVDREPVPRVTLLGELAKKVGRPMPPLAPGVGEVTDVRAMSERLAESGYRFRYPSFREGYGPLIARI